jgi:predicted transcriptional regulator
MSSFFVFAEILVVFQLVNYYNFLSILVAVGEINMKGKMLDTYERWEKSGHLETKLKAIAEMVSKRATQKEVAEFLGITEKTLIKLRKTHQRLDDAFEFGDEELKNNLIDAMYRRAVGFEYEETQTVIEETKTGQKKRITKFKKQSLPDIAAIKYLLITKFGIDFNEKKAEIELMARRIENGEEEWVNEYSDETNSRTKGIRKQSKK